MSFLQNFLESEGSAGLIDTFRSVFPSRRKFSYYSARHGDLGRRLGRGMRIDYVLSDRRPESPDDQATDQLETLAYIDDDLLHPYSDHCPVGASINLE